MKQRENQPSVESTSPSVNMSAMLDDVVKGGSDETDTMKTGSSTPSSSSASSSSSSSSSSLLNDEQQQQLLQQPQPHHYDDTILGLLARQLEYYFSKANLEKDTYVETLRELNDGCVPVTILQRFAKVQTLTPIDTIDAILKATTEHTSLLKVVPIDTKTGKRVVAVDDHGNNNKDDSDNDGTILAIGTTTGQPLDNSILQGVVASASAAAGTPVSTPKTPGTPYVQNTIIIREVDSRVTEEEVRALFDDEHCPPIQSLYLDVFNCWFVTLDTTSRDDMLYVMMQLRSQYLGDEPVKARLKSLVRQVDPASAPPLPVLTPTISYSHLSDLGSQQMMAAAGSNGTVTTSSSKSSNKRKHKKRGKKKKRAANNNGDGNGSHDAPDKKNSTAKQQQIGSGNRDGVSSKNDAAAAAAAAAKKRNHQQQQPKPDLTAESFPALSSSEGRKVEVVVGDKMDPEPKVLSSDSASTTTTLSSSSSSDGFKSKQHQLGGYAAALLKAKPANPPPANPPPAKADVNKGKGTHSGKVKADASKSVEKDEKKDVPLREKGSTSSASSKNDDASSPSSTAAGKESAVVVKPPAWGGGRSFADVLAM